MVKLRLFVPLLASCVVASGCGSNGSEPVETVMKNVPSYYSDTLTPSDMKELNYDGYFLGDAVDVTEGLDLFSEYMDTLAVEWEWIILNTDYMGKPLEVEGGVESPVSGTSKKLSGVVGSEKKLRAGQVMQITPRFGTYTDKNKKEVEQKNTFDYILIANYGSKDYKINQCVKVGWYTVFLNSFKDCFGLQPLEGEESVPDGEVFKRISEQLGSPTTMWEKPIEDKDFVSGIRNVVFGYEFPLYTIIADVVENNKGELIQGMYYVPRGLWLESKWYTGMKNTYMSAYYEIDRTELPEVKQNEESE